jgi:trehalose-6-phosphate synthase
MTKYELSKETMDRHFADSRRIASAATTMAAEQLTKDLIEVFEHRAQFFTLCERFDYVQGVQDCIEHLKAFLET